MNDPIISFDTGFSFECWEENQTPNLNLKQLIDAYKSGTKDKNAKMLIEKYLEEIGMRILNLFPAKQLVIDECKHHIEQYQSLGWRLDQITIPKNIFFDTLRESWESVE
jgi:hypothetical protein